MPRSAFNSWTIIPVIYDRKAGYKRNVKGEINDKSPAPNARNKVTCSKALTPTFWINDSYTINIGNICGETMQLKSINVKDIVCMFETHS